MAVRNFWIDADIDGRQTELSGGPRGRVDGMSIEIYQRDNGSIANCLKIVCREFAGELTTTVYRYDSDGNTHEIYKNKTKR